MTQQDTWVRGGAVFLVAASIASSIGGLPFNTLPILLGAFADANALTPATLGTLGSACTGGYLASTLLGPLWVDRVPWRVATLFAAVITACALLWSGTSSGTPYLPLAVFGFAAGLMHSLGMRMVGEVDNKERAFGVRLLTELIIVASLLYFLPTLIATHALTGGMTLLAVAVLIMATSAAFIPKGTATTSNSEQPINDDSAKMTIPTMGWVALVIFVLFACGQVALWVFIERIGKSIDVSASEMGLVFAVLKLVGGLSAALVAVVGDRLGNRWPHVWVLLFIAIGIVMLALPVNFWIYALGAWTWEAAFTVGCVYQTAAIAKLDASNRLVVLVPAAFAISAFIGPELAGNLAESGGFTPLFVLAISCAAIPAMAFWLLYKRAE